MVVTCIPFANGVPAASGPPIWWSDTGPIPQWNRRLDDPRWQGAVSRTYAKTWGGAGESAVFRGLYHTEEVGDIEFPITKTFLYLSFQVKVDVALNPGRDDLYLGFQGRRGGVNGAQLVIKISPITTANVPEDQMGVPLSGVTCYLYDAQQKAWRLMGDTPDWIAGVKDEEGNDGPGGRLWVSSSSPSWAVNLRVPFIDEGTVTDEGLNLGNAFRMWFQLHTPLPGNNFAMYSWPRDAVTVSEPDFPLPATEDPATSAPWGEFELGGSSVACSSGVSLGSLDIGTTNADSSEIRFDPIYDLGRPPVKNTFFARPHNTGHAIPPKGISARFRLANWGSAPGSEQAQNSGELWVNIPHGGQVENAGSIDEGSPSDPKTGELTFDWTLGPAEVEEFYPPDKAKRTMHQCMLVELSGPGIDFINSSVYRNMDVHAFDPVVNLRSLAAEEGSGRPRKSQFSRDAQISVVGLESIGAPERDVYIYLEAANMPKDEIQVNLRGEEPEAARLRARLLAGPGDGDGEPIRSDELARVLPTYRVYVFHDTGRTVTKKGEVLRVLEPQGSFGYFFVKEDESFGWDHGILGAGLQEIAPNFYKLSVPDNGTVSVSTEVRSWNQPRPQGDPVERARKALERAVLEIRTSRDAIRQAQEQRDCEDDLEEARQALGGARHKIHRVADTLTDGEVTGVRGPLDEAQGDIDHAQAVLYRAEESDDQGAEAIDQARMASVRAQDALDEAHEAIDERREEHDHDERRRAHRALWQAHEGIDAAQVSLDPSSLVGVLGELNRARQSMVRERRDTHEEELRRGLEAVDRVRRKVLWVQRHLQEDENEGIRATLEEAQQGIDHVRATLHHHHHDHPDDPGHEDDPHDDEGRHQGGDHG